MPSPSTTHDQPVDVEQTLLDDLRRTAGRRNRAVWALGITWEIGVVSLATYLCELVSRAVGA